VSIEKGLQDAIMQEDFVHIRMTATCKFWVRESVQANCKALEALTDRPSDQDTSRQDNGPVLPRENTVMAPSTLEGHTMIWRATTKRDAEAFFNSQSQEIDIFRVGSLPGDFSAVNLLTYFTPQKKPAERYLQWLIYRCPIAEIAIVQVAVLDPLIQGLNVKCLWSDESKILTEEWKKFSLARQKAEAISA
jgi:hypothetical protein